MDASDLIPGVSAVAGFVVIVCMVFLSLFVLVYSWKIFLFSYGFCICFFMFLCWTKDVSQADNNKLNT